jgi:geranylgeranyl diphosphate synthase, type II
MQSFVELSQQFETKFNVRHFPEQPATLYDAAQYILVIGGKRIRPVCVLMGNELFGEINDDAWQVATAVELFHNFSLIHDDIMDKAPLRRGMQTVHTKFGDDTALLAGDVMFAQAYDYLTRINLNYVQKIIKLFNKTSKEVCEGQQLDMDFEKQASVNLEDYVNMITLKTSVLLAASLQLGAILGGAGEGNQQHLYEFGKNLGIAFQIQDDYLDAFGDPTKFGKQIGGDILANKKTFLQIHTMEVATLEQKESMLALKDDTSENKIANVLEIYKACKVDEWAKELKEKYFAIALKHLEDTAVLENRKNTLRDLAVYLMERDN